MHVMRKYNATPQRICSFIVSDDDEVVILNYDALSSFQMPIFLSVYDYF